MAKFSKHRFWNDDLPKQLRQQIYFVDEDEVIQRRSIGDNDHLGEKLLKHLLIVVKVINSR